MAIAHDHLCNKPKIASCAAPKLQLSHFDILTKTSCIIGMYFTSGS